MNEQERKALIKYRINRAKETLDEITILATNGLWNTAINRMYYACYYAVIALLISKNIETHTHSGFRQMFGLHFIKSKIIDKELGKFYSDLFDKRQTGDYEDFIDFNESDIQSMLPIAKQLVSEIKKLL